MFQFQTNYSQSNLRVELSPQERGVYSNYFQLADTDSSQKITGQQALAFFNKSNLPTTILRDIWDIANPNGDPFLDREKFYVALRLIAYAQNGIQVSSQSILSNVSAPLPDFGQIQAKVQKEDSYQPREQIDRDRYMQMFQMNGGGKGFLTGMEAKEIFQSSGLGLDQLKKLWDLVNKQGQPNLNANQFIVAMHILDKRAKQGQEIPNQLPQNLQQIIDQGQQRSEPQFGFQTEIPQPRYSSQGSSGGMPSNQKMADPFDMIDSGFSIPSIDSSITFHPPVVNPSRKSIDKPPEPQIKEVVKEVIKEVVKEVPDIESKEELLRQKQRMLQFVQEQVRNESIEIQKVQQMNQEYEQMIQQAEKTIAQLQSNWKQVNDFLLEQKQKALKQYEEMQRQMMSQQQMMAQQNMPQTGQNNGQWSGNLMPSANQQANYGSNNSQGSGNLIPSLNQQANYGSNSSQNPFAGDLSNQNDPFKSEPNFGFDAFQQDPFAQKQEDKDTFFNLDLSAL